MQTCFPLDNKKYFAKDMRMWHIGRVSGVINATGHDYETHAGVGMQTIVGPGCAYVKTGTAEPGGAMHYNDGNVTFTHSPADSILDRIDSIIIRYDGLNGTCQLVKVEGTPASSPTAYQPVRNANIYELVLQNININHGIAAISDSMIHSQILNESVCGLAVDTLAKIPTAQYDAQIKAWIEENQVAFTQWFETIKDSLSGDVAGNLYNQIWSTNGDVYEIRDLANEAISVGAIGQNLANNAYDRIMYGYEPPVDGVSRTPVEGDIYIQLKKRV